MRDNSKDGSADLNRLIAEQAAVLTTAQATAFLTPGVVYGHLEQRRWRRLCHGVLLAENGRLMRDQQLWAAVLAAGEGARLAGETAAIEGGVKGLRSEPIDVLLPTGRRWNVPRPRLAPDMPVVRIHRTAILPTRHQQAGRPPRTTVARAVIDAAAWARSDDEARNLIAAACQQGRATAAALHNVVDLFPHIRRHQLMITTIADVAGGATALSEINLLQLCRQFELPAPDLQRRRLDESGRNRYVDAEWTGARLLVEIDGSHHMDVRHWAADMLRQNQIWVTGDRILRFPAWLVRSEPATVARQIHSALIAATPSRATRPQSTR